MCCIKLGHIITIFKTKTTFAELTMFREIFHIILSVSQNFVLDLNNDMIVLQILVHLLQRNTIHGKTSFVFASSYVLILARGPRARHIYIYREREVIGKGMWRVTGMLRWERI